jgi:hypothetical protein
VRTAYPVGSAVCVPVASRAGTAAGCHTGAADERHAARRRHQSAVGQSVLALHVRHLDAANVPGVLFERYADDAIVHCKTEQQAKAVLAAIRGRFEQCGLALHPTKTRIVYCKDANRPGQYEHVSFDFLGFTFQPRRARNRQGQDFSSFLPAMSTKAAKHVRRTREWRLASTKNQFGLEELPKLVDPVVRGGCSTTAGSTGRSVC